jgi:hypothetical protein
MTQPDETNAPTLGESTDVTVDTDELKQASPHGGPGGTTGAGDDAEQTIDTPDELGGTGGSQPGGAG